jgi:aspartate aminotransferase
MVAPRLPLSDRIALLRPTAVNAILAEVRQVQANGRKVVSLMRGEPDFATPLHIKAAAIMALNDGRTHYPDNRGEPALREAIAARLHDDYNLRYDPSREILVTTGATLGIYAALAAVLNDGDEVLLPDPIYDAYHSPIRLVGGRVRSVRAELRGERYCLGIDVLDAAWTPNCKCLLLNTPWNPVGTVFTRQELSDIAEFVQRRNLILISDEIYEAITYGECVHQPPATISEALRARTILVNSLSKTYAMTGWRLGYCAGPRELVEAMFLVLQQSSRGPATFVQDAAVAALKGPQACVQEMRREFSRRRTLVGERLRGIDGVRALLPEGGFFALVDVRALGRTSDEVRRQLLHHWGVVVVHGAAYGPAAEGILRVSFASGGDILADGLESLRSGLLAISSEQREH